MKFPIYQVDAFTNRRFGGNPAAVVLLEEWLPDAVMQNIGLENNLSETAFVIPREDISSLRWFTPTVEIDLCGHATLAAGYVLFKYQFPLVNSVQFQTRSGKLGVRREGRLFVLDFPSLPPLPEAVPETSSSLGVSPREILRSNALVAVFDTEAEILGIRPDFERLKTLGSHMITVTAPGSASDYVFRVFGPAAGIPEDPATGSAQCSLVPYWSARLGKTNLTSRQLSARSGEFVCGLHGNRVSISGGVVEYLRGEIDVD
jgi:predicted PhzF superfamily epimerase YddE/YHI9